MKNRSALQVFSWPDDLKLRSSMTLFQSISPPGSVFGLVIDKYFDGEPDPGTIRMLKQESE